MVGCDELEIDGIEPGGAAVPLLREGRWQLYRWAWSFQVVRIQPGRSMPSITRCVRRSKIVMPVFAWPDW